MAYLAKQKKGNSTYYYLVENVKLAGGRREQKRKYLGKEKPSEKKLQLLMSNFEKEIEKERVKTEGFHFLSREEANEIDSINSDFQKRYSKQNKTVQGQFDDDFLMAFVYNTNSIEGSTLTPKEVELLLDEDIAPNRPLGDVLEAKSAGKALEFVKSYAGKFDEAFLLKVHKIYFEQTKPYIAGKYKTKQNRIRGSKCKTVLPEAVPLEMRFYFKEFKEREKELHPLELAAWAHWKLEQIHPFQDGNGRIGRLVMNFVLHSHGYAMIDIKTKEKQDYFKALQKCDSGNNPKALAVRLVRRFKKQYGNALMIN